MLRFRRRGDALPPPGYPASRDAVEGGEKEKKKKSKDPGDSLRRAATGPQRSFSGEFSRERPPTTTRILASDDAFFPSRTFTPSSFLLYLHGAAVGPRKKGPRGIVSSSASILSMRRTGGLCKAVLLVARRRRPSLAHLHPLSAGNQMSSSHSSRTIPPRRDEFVSLAGSRGSESSSFLRPCNVRLYSRVKPSVATRVHSATAVL